MFNFYSSPPPIPYFILNNSGLWLLFFGHIGNLYDMSYDITRPIHAIDGSFEVSRDNLINFSHHTFYTDISASSSMVLSVFEGY